MDKSKKTRRRRSPEPGDKKITKKAPRKKVPTADEKEKDAAVLSRTRRSSKPLTGVDRLNAIPDYTQTIQESIVAKTYGKYATYTVAQLKAAIKDPYNTVLEAGIIAQLIRSMTKGATAAQIIKYVHDRLEGKPKDRVEHSGPDGGPIETSDAKVTFDIENMTKAKRDELKKTLLTLKKMPVVVVEEDEDDSSSKA